MAWREQEHWIKQLYLGVFCNMQKVENLNWPRCCAEFKKYLQGSSTLIESIWGSQKAI